MIEPKRIRQLVSLKILLLLWSVEEHVEEYT